MKKTRLYDSARDIRTHLIGGLGILAVLMIGLSTTGVFYFFFTK